MDQQGLDVGVTTAATHVGNTEERAGLIADIAAVVIELGLVLENRLRVNLLIITTVALARVDEEIVHREGVHFLGRRNKIHRRIGAGAN